MIRILHVVTYMGRGGLETMLMNYYRSIDRSQIQFDFMTHRSERYDYDDEIEGLGGIIYRMPRLNPFSRKYRKELGAFFDAHPEYQIIHVHQDCLSSVILKVATEHHVRVRIAHSHSSNQDKNIKYLIKLWYKRSIPQYATDLFACGDEAGKWMFDGAPFRVLNNAIDAKQYTFNEQVRAEQRSIWNIGNKELLVGHVGRFFPAKNHLFLIELFNEVQKKVPAKLILVGDGELKPSIERKIIELHLEEKVILTGIRSDVAHILQAVDVFVFPSIYEGLPLTIVEAQAAGLPCLISDAVPIECKKTDLVYQISLSDNAEYWANQAIGCSNMVRRDTYQEICQSGFDIQSNVKWLEKYYQSSLGE